MFEKAGISILTPIEYEQLRGQASKKGKYQLDLLLYTGMRYAEVQKLHKNPGWFDSERKTIHLPKTADRKVKRVSPDRYVILSNLGNFIIDRYFEEKRPPFPSYVAFYKNMKRWAKKAKLNANISLKTTRKTWESWLTVSFPQLVPVIAMSQGHTTLIAMQHYINIPFSPFEIKQIKEKTAGWDRSA